MVGGFCGMSNLAFFIGVKCGLQTKLCLNNEWNLSIQIEFEYLVRIPIEFGGESQINCLCINKIAS